MYEWFVSLAHTALVTLIVVAGLYCILVLVCYIAEFPRERKYKAYLKSIKDPAVRAKVDKEYKFQQMLGAKFESHNLFVTRILTEEEFISYMECVDDPATKERLWGHFKFNHRGLYRRTENMPRFSYDWEKGT